MENIIGSSGKILNRFGFPEQLMLIASRVQPLTGDLRHIHSMMLGEGDWKQLHRVAVDNGVLSLVWKNLQKLDMPRWFWKEGRNIYVRTSLFNTKLFELLEEVLDALGSKGICAVPMKGCSLIDSVYRDEGLRLMLDCDLLVREHDLFAIKEVMKAIGFNRRRILRSQHLYLKHGVKFELHWKLMTPKRFRACFDTETIFSECSVLPDRRFPAINPLREFLYIILHFYAHHNSLCLYRLVDIAELADRGVWDWEEMLEMARSIKVEKILYFVLYLSHDMLGSRWNRQWAEDVGVRGQMADRLSRFRRHSVLNGREDISELLLRWRVEFDLAGGMLRRLRTCLRPFTLKEVNKLIDAIQTFNSRTL